MGIQALSFTWRVPGLRAFRRFFQYPNVSSEGYTGTVSFQVADSATGACGSWLHQHADWLLKGWFRRMPQITDAMIPTL